MYYTSTIYDPAQGIDQIFTAASKFNTERFLYALQYKTGTREPWNLWVMRLQPIEGNWKLSITDL